jgi:hypothetical protein
MANIIKIQNHLAKRERTKEKKRVIETKEVRVYFLIVCEGEKTEPNYFKSFKTNVKSFVYTIDTFGEATNTKDLVRRTILARDKSSQKYDSVWAVFDKDSFSSDNFNSAINLAESNDVKVGWTNEAFELWYLLHFQYRNTAMSREEYKSALEKEVNAKIAVLSKSKKPNKFVYEKNSKEMFAVLEKYGNQKEAIKNAEKLIANQNCTNFAAHNPCTRIHLLVQELNGDSEELNEQIKQKIM